MPVWGLRGSPLSPGVAVAALDPRSCQSELVTPWLDEGPPFCRPRVALATSQATAATSCTQLGTQTAAVLSLCVPASQAGTLGQAGPSLCGPKLSYNRAVISLCVLCARPPGRGSAPKRPCVFLLPAASEYLSSGKTHESPGKVGGAWRQPVPWTLLPLWAPHTPLPAQETREPEGPVVQ